MKLIIKDYLKGMQERDNLEIVLHRLLSQMGLHVLSEPHRGNTQKGVDILAVGKMEGDIYDTVYLLTIKEGDLKRGTWSGGNQKVRESVQEILDAYIPNRLLPQHAALGKKICICFGGTIDEQVEENIAGFVKTNQASFNASKASLECWNGDKIADMICSYLMSPDLICGDRKRLLFRSLATVEEPDSAVEAFKHFLGTYPEKDKHGNDKDSPKHISRDVSQICVALGLVRHYCIECSNLDAAYRCAEFALLFCWDYLFLRKKDLGKRGCELFDSLWWMYIEIGTAYAERIATSTGEQFLTMMACRPNSEIDVNIRIFDVIGRIASLGAGLLYYYSVLCKLNSDAGESWKKTYEATLKRLREILASLIRNNPTCETPIQDNNSFEVAMTSVFLYQMGYEGFIKGWIDAIWKSTSHNLAFHRPIPANGSYEELLLRYRGAIDKDGENGGGQASSLYPTLMLIPAVFDWIDVYEFGLEVCKRYLNKVDFQLWYPQEDSATELFKLPGDARPHGYSYVSLRPSILERYRTEVFAECDNSKLPFSCIGGPFVGLVFIGCRCHRYPLPPHWLKALYEHKKKATSTNADKSTPLH